MWAECTLAPTALPRAGPRAYEARAVGWYQSRAFQEFEAIVEQILEQRNSKCGWNQFPKGVATQSPGEQCPLSSPA